MWKCICLNWNINLRSSRASIKWSIGSLGRSIFRILIVYFYNCENVFFQIGRLIWERSSRASMKWSIWSLDRMRNDLLKTFNPLFDRFKFHINKHNILRFQCTSTSRKCPPWHQLRKLITKNMLWTKDTAVFCQFYCWAKSWGTKHWHLYMRKCWLLIGRKRFDFLWKNDS